MLKIPNRNPQQIYIAMFEDSPRVQNLIHPLISRNFINWTMTYRRDSDIPNPYGRIVHNKKVENKLKQLIGSNLNDMYDKMERDIDTNSKMGYINYCNHCNV